MRTSTFFNVTARGIAGGPLLDQDGRPIIVRRPEGCNGVSVSARRCDGAAFGANVFELVRIDEATGERHSFPTAILINTTNKKTLKPVSCDADLLALNLQTAVSSTVDAWFDITITFHSKGSGFVDDITQ